MTDQYQQPPVPPQAPVYGWMPPAAPAPKSHAVRNIIVAAVAVFLLLAAYGAGSAGEEPSPAPAATGRIVVVAPTPMPTVLPTRLVTAAPTIAPAIDDGDYMAYITWGVTYTGAVGDKLDSISATLDAADVKGSLALARDLLKLNKDAVSYLTANPPAACYADAHAYSLKAARHMVTAGEAQVRWLSTFPDGTDADLDTYQNEMAAGATDLGDGTEALKVVVCQ